MTMMTPIYKRSLTTGEEGHSECDGGGLLPSLSHRCSAAGDNDQQCRAGVSANRLNYSAVASRHKRGYPPRPPPHYTTRRVCIQRRLAVESIDTRLPGRKRGEVGGAGKWLCIDIELTASLRPVSGGTSQIQRGVKKPHGRCMTYCVRDT